MGLVERFRNASTDDEQAPAPATSLADGAIDTVSTMLRVLGEAAFATDRDPDTQAFLAECAAFARHVENGSSVPSANIEQRPDAARDWSRVRTFFSNRRFDERDFVERRLGDYREVVEDLISGLRHVGERDQKTEESIIECLSDLEKAAEQDLPDIRDAVSQAVETVQETFAKQRDAYEQEIQQLNERLANMRQDLVAAREEMKRDTLTEVFNRGAFDTGIAQCVNMHFISNQPVTLVLIDLDKFKDINDHHGHAAGDQVLREIGEALSRTFIRKSDLVCRYGGDEFAVILNDTTADSAEPLLNRLFERIRTIRVPGNDQANVTCSIGFAEIHADDDPEAFVNRADRALYRSKDAGRDRATFISATEADRA